MIGEEPEPEVPHKMYETAPHELGKKAISTPAVRHLAKKHNIDINNIKGTGKQGRVTKEDILKFIAGG